jgi:hypothetical protein
MLRRKAGKAPAPLRSLLFLCTTESGEATGETGDDAKDQRSTWVSWPTTAYTIFVLLVEWAWPARRYSNPSQTPAMYREIAGHPKTQQSLVLDLARSNYVSNQ